MAELAHDALPAEALADSPRGASHGADGCEGCGQQTNNMSAGNVNMGTNYGNMTMNSYHCNDDSINFGLLRDLPDHPDIKGQLGQYFPDSRRQDEEHILAWLDQDDSRELVLCALARVGMGKSTFAHHLAERLWQKRQLAASIFFSFAPSHWGVGSIIKLIAQQLARALHPAVGLISTAIRLYGGHSVPLEVQIEKFILDPIRHLRCPRPLVVILDAPDEWPLLPRLAEALAHFNPHSDLIRFIIFGRPGLQDHFKNVSTDCYSLSAIPNNVMEAYIDSRFDHILWTFGRKPNPQTIAELAEKADGLFMWTTTVCSFIEKTKGLETPEDILTAVLNSRRSVGDHDALANLYRNAFALRFPTLSSRQR